MKHQTYVAVLITHTTNIFPAAPVPATNTAAVSAARDDEAEVEMLLQRVSDALMPDYRREALGLLRDRLTGNIQV